MVLIGFDIGRLLSACSNLDSIPTELSLSINLIKITHRQTLISVTL